MFHVQNAHGINIYNLDEKEKVQILLMDEVSWTNVLFQKSIDEDTVT